MHDLKFLNVFGVVLVIFLAGTVGYFLGVRTSRAPGVVQSQNENGISSVSSSTGTSTAVDIADVLGGILNWKIDDAAFKTLTCDDGTSTAPGAKIVHLGVGPVNPDENTVQEAITEIQAALRSDKWTKCRTVGPGPNIQETYRKNSQLFQIEANYSMGTGNTLDLFFEYSG